MKKKINVAPAVAKAPRKRSATGMNKSSVPDAKKKKTRRA